MTSSGKRGLFLRLMRYHLNFILSPEVNSSAVGNFFFGAGFECLNGSSLCFSHFQREKKRRRKRNKAVPWSIFVFVFKLKVEM